MHNARGGVKVEGAYCRLQGAECTVAPSSQHASPFNDSLQPSYPPHQPHSLAGCLSLSPACCCRDRVLLAVGTRRALAARWGVASAAAAGRAGVLAQGAPRVRGVAAPGLLWRGCGVAISTRLALASSGVAEMSPHPKAGTVLVGVVAGGGVAGATPLAARGCTGVAAPAPGLAALLLYSLPTSAWGLPATCKCMQTQACHALACILTTTAMLRPHQCHCIAVQR